MKRSKSSSEKENPPTRIVLGSPGAPSSPLADQDLALGPAVERLPGEVAVALDHAKSGMGDQRLELGGEELSLRQLDDPRRALTVDRLVVDADQRDLADRIVVVVGREER